MNFINFLDIHKGKSCIIAGCGSSLNLIKDYKIDISIFGVNDVPKLIEPTYLVVVDNPAKFKNGRDKIVSNSNANYVFTQIPEWKINSGRKVLFKLGMKSSLTNLDHKNDIIDCSNNSPYMCVIIAYKMGFTNIGLIGVDFTPNHFYAEDGNHSLVSLGQLDQINKDYKLLYNTLKARNVNLYNLNPNSEVKEVPHLNIKDFLK